MKTTKIDEIEDLADGVPVLIVEGSVKYASDVKQGTTGKTDWSRQFFVLTSGTAEVGCTLWDADGNAMKKGESVRIENTQDKKGHWTGITKGSYSKDGKLNHTLEIRSEKVKITHPNGQQGEPSAFQQTKAAMQGDPLDYPNSPDRDEIAPRSPVHAQQGEDGVQATRKHLMQTSNLMVLCIKAADYVALQLPEVAHTSEQFAGILGQLFKEAYSRRTTDGVNWWSYSDKMPTTPLVPNGKHSTAASSKPKPICVCDNTDGDNPLCPIHST